MTAAAAKTTSTATTAATATTTAKSTSRVLLYLNHHLPPTLPRRGDLSPNLRTRSILHRSAASPRKLNPTMVQLALPLPQGQGSLTVNKKSKPTNCAWSAKTYAKKPRQPARVVSCSATLSVLPTSPRQLGSNIPEICVQPIQVLFGAIVGPTARVRDTCAPRVRTWVQAKPQPLLGCTAEEDSRLEKMGQRGVCMYIPTLTCLTKTRPNANAHVFITNGNGDSLSG